MSDKLVGPDYQNYTRTDLENFLLLAWTSISFVLGISGNILVLVAAFRRGIRIDKTSLLVIKNLAFSDITFNLIWVLPTLTTLVADQLPTLTTLVADQLPTLTTLVADQLPTLTTLVADQLPTLTTLVADQLPTLTTLVANQWVLGNVVCHVTTYLQYTTAIATICFITIFSVNKFIRCKFPLKSWNISTALGYVLTAAVWTFAFIHPAMYFFGNLVRADKRRIMLYPPKSSCDYYHGLDLSTYWQRIDLLCAVLYTFIPSIILIVVNIGLIRLVKQKEKGSFNKSNHSNLTLLLIITGVFVVSYAPYIVKYSVPILGMKTDVLSNWFKTLMNFMLYTNSWFNPFAYYSTNSAFRRFMYCFFTCKPYRPVRGSVITSAVIIENNSSVQDSYRVRSHSLAPGIRSSPHTTPHNHTTPYNHTTPHHNHTTPHNHGPSVSKVCGSPGVGNTVNNRLRVNCGWRPPNETTVIEDLNESGETIA